MTVPEPAPPRPEPPPEPSRSPLPPELAALPPPPEPPAALVETTRVVGVATALWFLAWVVTVAAHLLAGRPWDLWFGATLCGWVLGLTGYSVFRWQRWAARTGRRGAQRVS